MLQISRGLQRRAVIKRCAREFNNTGQVELLLGGPCDNEDDDNDCNDDDMMLETTGDDYADVVFGWFVVRRLVQAARHPMAMSHEP